MLMVCTCCVCNPHRSNRAEIKGQNTKTYMDAEDGLFNNTLERTAEFDTFGTKAGQKISARAAALATGSIIPGKQKYHLKSCILS